MTGALIRKGKLTPEQIIVAEQLALPKKNGKTIGQLAEEVGTSERTIYRWRAEPAFADYVRLRTMQHAVAHLPDVLDALTVKAMRGDSVKAAEIWLRAMGVMSNEFIVRPATENERSNEAIIADLDRMTRLLEAQEREYEKGDSDNEKQLRNI